MNDQQNSTPFPGVALIRKDHGLYYSGSKHALVATGLFKIEWFPGEQGNPLTITRIEGKKAFKTGFSPAEIDRIEITRHDGSSKLFHAKAYFLWDITRKNYKLREIPEAKKKAMDLALSWVNGLPENEQEFKAFNARYLEACSSIKDWGFVYKRGGYSMTMETVEKYNAAVAALREVVMNGSLIFSEPDHVAARLKSTREAFDRHLASYYPESQRDSQYEIFNLEVEAQLDGPALTGKIDDIRDAGLLAA